MIIISKCFATSATVLVQGFRFFGCSAVRRHGCSAVRRFDGSAVRRFGGSAVRLFGGSAVRLFFGSVVRLFRCSGVRRLGPEGANCGWVGIAKSMKTTTVHNFCLIFEGLGDDFSAVLGKFGADLGSLELFWFQGLVFGRFSAMLRQVGAKMATKRGRMGELGRNMGSRWTHPGPGSTRAGGAGSPLILVPINPSTTEHVTSPIHAPVLEARWRI